MRAAPSLQSKRIKDILREDLILPLMRSPLQLLAFRLGWIHDTDDVFLQNAWQRILLHQAHFDSALQTMPGVVGFISAVNGTSVFKAKRDDASIKYWRTYPGIACFLICRSDFTQRVLCDSAKTMFPEATLKFLLQPFQREEKAIMSALCTVVKENIECGVRRLLYENLSDRPENPSAFSMVRCSALGEPAYSIVRHMAVDLNTAGFPVDLYDERCA